MYKLDQILVDRDGIILPDISSCELFAGSEKLIGKALEYQIERNGDFDVTADLEDGADKTQSPERNLEVALQYLDSDLNKFNKLGVRILDLDNPFWEVQFEHLLTKYKKLAYITIPKITTVKDLGQLETLAAKFEVWDVDFARWLNKGNRVQLHLIFETLTAANRIEEILSYGKNKYFSRIFKITVSDFGIIDFVAAHQGVLSTDIMQSDKQFDHPLMAFYKNRHVAVSLAHGVVPAHNITISLDTDIKQTFLDAKRARFDFSFLRMWAIHKNQVEMIMDGMRPLQDWLANSQRDRCAKVLLQAKISNFGPIAYTEYDGKRTMEDKASYRSYWALLKMAKRAGIALPTGSDVLFEEV